MQILKLSLNQYTPVNLIQKKSYTKQYQKHIPSSFCYYIKCFDDIVYEGKPVTYTAENEDDDVAQIFMNHLKKDVKFIYSHFLKSSSQKENIFTTEDKEKYKTSRNCHICGGELGEDRVRDHCHFTGEFRGAAM